MTRISRTIALSATAMLALGIAACTPPHQKTSDAPQVTTVSPESGYQGAGKATGAAESGSASATTAATELSSGADTGLTTGGSTFSGATASQEPATN